MTAGTDLKPPKVWLAVVLSMVVAGLGHVYSGRVARALGVFIALQALLFLGNMFFARGPVRLPALAGFTVAALAVSLAIFFDAARCARAGRLRFGSRRAVIGACVVYFFASGGAGLLLEGLRERYAGKSFYIPSEGMAPTLLVGDHLFSNPGSYASSDPQRGDIVIFTAARNAGRVVPVDSGPGLPRERFVKRIVGVPGDSIGFDGHVLVVNGDRKTGPSAGAEFMDAKGRKYRIAMEVLDERQYEVLDHPSLEPGSVGPVTVEPDRYFVAGDNRDNSYDSHHFGTIHRDDFVGPTSSIYWSWDFTGGYLELLSPPVWYELLRTKTRWDRIGMITNPLVGTP